MASRLWSGEFKQIGIETMDKLCDLFNCSYNDLFGYESAPVAPKPKQKSGVWTGKPGGGSLAEILAEGNSGEPFKHSVLDIVQSSSDNETLLSTADVAQRLGINERTVRDNYNNGKLPFVKRGTKNLVRESDFIAFRDSRISA
jgi:excisionase family DNA binding protein